MASSSPPAALLRRIIGARVRQPYESKGTRWRRYYGCAGFGSAFTRGASRGIIHQGIVMAPRNAFYAQSGGVSAVINASACGVLETARRHSDMIGKVYAGRNGIVGALTEDLIDTSLEAEAAIAALK